MTGKPGRAPAPISFSQHVAFGIQLDAAIKTLEALHLAAAGSHGEHCRQLRKSASKAIAAINMVRNDAENLLCTTVPASEHTKNPCSVYYGTFGGE